LRSRIGSVHQGEIQEETNGWMVPPE